MRYPVGAGIHATNDRGASPTANTAKLSSGGRDRSVAARVLAIGARVEDETDWLVGKLADDGDDGRRARPSASVDQHDAVRTSLHRDVSAIARDHVDLPLHVDDIETVVRGGSASRARGGFGLGNGLR
jgi:hypothetical protein